MSTKQKIVISIVAVLLIAVILYFVFRKKKDEVIADPASLLNSGSSAPKSNFIPESFPLNLNMQGDSVKRLQMALNRLNTTSPKIAEDGIFGMETKTKLLRTVPITQSTLPMAESTLIDIIKKANNLQ